MYLITGAAGFIGSNLCHYLLEKNEDFIALDGLFVGSNIKNLENKTLVHVVDIKDEDHLMDIFDYYKPDKIIHLAAQSHVDRSIDSDKPFWSTNVVGTSNLLRCAKRFGVKSFINQITDEVYGCKPAEGALEGDKFYPTSPYPCSKAGQYYVGKSFYTTYEVPVISTLPVNCFGPRQYPEKLIPKFIHKLLNNEKVPLMASTHFERDWLAVEDMCRALYLLSNVGVPGEDYNVGADNHYTNIDLTKKILAHLGKSEDLIEIVPDRKAHDSRYALNFEKLLGVGFKHKHTFDEYLRYTINWYKEKFNAQA